MKRPLAAKPTHGMRLLLLLDRANETYRGTARTPDETWEVDVELAGDVVDGSAGGGTSQTVTVATSAPKDVADYVRRVVRIAVRDAKASRLPLPRTIHRWRAEKD